MTVQQDEIERVEGDITQLVIDWFNQHGPGHTFHLGEFTKDILNQKLCSPTSPYRIMALLKQKGQLNYTVINRSQSLYCTTQMISEDDDLNFEEEDIEWDV